MDIFNRIVRFFSSLDSSSTNRFPARGIETEKTRFERKRKRLLNSNSHASRRETSNGTNIGSNTTSIVTRASMISYVQPDLQSQRENTRRGFKDVLFFSENQNYSTDQCVKTSGNTSIGFCRCQSIIPSNNKNVSVQEHPNPKPHSILVEFSITEITDLQSTPETVGLSRPLEHPTITSEQTLNAKESSYPPGHFECLSRVPRHKSMFIT